MPIYLTKNATIVTLKEPTWPEGPEVTPRQAIGVSGGGRIQVAQTGDPDTLIVLNFVRIAAAQFAALDSFIQTTVSWSGYTFQYQDWNSVTLNNIRYMRGIETWKRERGGLYRGQLTLKQDLGV